MSEQQVRVRFAPSPTGYLHVGGARTALYCYLYAKRHGGKFILRIEDTDLERSTEEAMRMQIQDLNWLGLHWDEGPHPETLKDMGDYGPYRQSQRKEIYQKYADQLLEQGDAYYCFLSDEEIEAQREQAKKEKRPPQVKSPYRDWTVEKALEFKKTCPTPPVIRFKVKDEKTDYVLQDLVRGDVTFPSDMVGDFVVIRSNGMPVYNFCCVVDDALMKMTHVFRGEDHLSNTLRQIMVYDALNFEKPKFGHLSMILGEDRQKLSKRHGATSVNDFNEKGFLPEAMNNFLALLGWSSPKAQEIITMDELCEQFHHDRLNPASAVFDEKKLTWVNATHLRQLPHAELWNRLQPFFAKAGINLSDDPAWQNKALETMKTSMETLTDAIELFKPLSNEPFKVSDKAAEVLSWETTSAVINKWIELVSAKNELSADDFQEILAQIKTECAVKGKQLFMPIRVAIIGEPQGAEVKLLVPLMAKQELIDRANQCLN